MNSDSSISFADAIDTLSCVGEVDFNEKGEVMIPSKDAPRSVRAKKLAKRMAALVDEDGVLSIDKIRSLFVVVLDHLKERYATRSSYSTESQPVAGIKSIMVIIGESAKKLDRVTYLFKKFGGVLKLEEYRELQDFYARHVERTVDQSVISRWILGLAEASKSIEEIKDRYKESEHVFVDLEAVRNDTEYELLLMRKEDGTRFYSPRLIRNIKLVCDFGGYIHESPKEDIFDSILNWREEVAHVAAVNLVRTLQIPMKKFYEELFRFRNRELVGDISKIFMALFLAANPRNRFLESKGCAAYFNDFQVFLREALSSRSYQKLLAYPSQKDNNRAVLDVLHATCRALYLHTDVFKQLFGRVKQIIEQEKKSSREGKKGLYLWSRLAFDYGETLKALKVHSNGPLKRILEEIEEGKFAAFDSLLQFNLPHLWYELSWTGKRYGLLRLPSPTRQVLVNRAVINDEFKGFLMGENRQGTRANHLLINLQDRLSWRDEARCKVLEQLKNSASFATCYHMVTLDIDSDFYHQTGLYDSMKEAEKFKSTFENMLKDKNGAFHFPDEVSTEERGSWWKKALEAIHHVFFKGEKTLSIQERQVFIQLMYVLIELKFIEWIQPYTFSFSCKDGIDIGTSHTALLYAFLNILQKDEVTESEVENLDVILYAPALLVRERALLPAVFNRFIGTIKEVELMKEKIGAPSFRQLVQDYLDPLYSDSLLTISTTLATPQEEVKWQQAA